MENVPRFFNLGTDTLYKGPDRRKYKRIPINFLVIYSVSKPIEVIITVGSKTKTALMLDLSAGGTAILTNDDIPASTILLLKFTLVNILARGDDRVRTMEITGETRYNTSSEKNTHRLGIYFTQINKEDKAAIVNLVNLEQER